MSSYVIRPDQVPNSQSDKDAPGNADPKSEEDRDSKIFRSEDHNAPGDGNQSKSYSLHSPAQKSNRARPFTPQRNRKECMVLC